MSSTPSLNFADSFPGRLRQAIETTFGPRGIAAFCAASGIHRRTIDGYLSGEFVPDLRMAETICRFVKVEASWLLTSETAKANIVAEGAVTYNDSATAAELRATAKRLEELADRLDREGELRRKK